MPVNKVLTKVWITDGCVVCETCTNNCPEVFEIRDNTCLVRPQAQDTKFLQPLTDLIVETAIECPVNVIAYQTEEKDVTTPQVNLLSDNGGEISEEISRRSLLSSAGAGWLALGGSAVVGVLATQRFMFPNVLEESNPKVCIGELSKYMEIPIGGVNQDFKKQGILIVRLVDRIAALSTSCTHLGCIINWQESEKVFKCPCHGSGFTHQGINIDGPASRPLERYKILIDEGMVVVDRSRKYQYQKGDWDNPESFVNI
ncbi:MAG: Rieske 2Fe-2S domain-containing protein [Planctomycetota bacterium]|nr:MAG: Rieske 2Fe-2S domain-containing protein [Planctomycetota bacterium]